MGNADCLDRIILVVEMLNNSDAAINLKPGCFMIE